MTRISPLPFAVRLAPGLAAAGALMLTACGDKETGQTKRADISVRNESGPLPAPGQANRLLNEQSSFLRRHAQDPVDWYPWGDEAFAKAKAENKLVLLVVGYASCPWTEKMTEESYRDPSIARFMNRYFVNILVDREERPDVNNAFLNYYFVTSGKSGWPLHTWLTPGGLPMASGVYFPKVSTSSSDASWELTISHRALIWDRYRDTEIKAASTRVQAYAATYASRINQPQADPALETLGKGPPPKLVRPLEANSIREGFTTIAGVFDPVSGGFARQPKFPATFIMEFLLRYAAMNRADRYGSPHEALRMVEQSINRMCRGALRDQLGGGFHRYSRDVYWATPQFEKMLYDQGFLSQLLIHAGAALGRSDFLEWAEETLKYADRDLSHPEGAFYCADGSMSPRSGGNSGGDGDAGEVTDGIYYLWKLDEISKLLTPAELAVAKQVWNLAEDGNIPVDSPSYKMYRGYHTIREVESVTDAAKVLKLSEEEVSQTLKSARAKLLTSRQQRPRPLRDDKVIASWNGTMISGFATAAWALGRDELRTRAERAMNFVLTKLRNAESGELIHAYLDRGSTAPGYSEDYAHVVAALLDLYEATGSLRWLDAADQLMEKHIALLYDETTGLFFDGPKQPLLFHQMRSFDETTELSPSSTAMISMMRLQQMLPRDPKAGKDYNALAEKAFEEIGPIAAASPTGHVRLVTAWDMHRLPPLQIIVDGPADAPETKALLDAIRPLPRPNSVIIHLNSDEARTRFAARTPAVANLKPADGKPSILFCRGFKLLKAATVPSDAAAYMKGEFMVPKEQ